MDSINISFFAFKGLLKDGYKLVSKCGLWTDIYKKITETKILMIALVVQPSIRRPAADHDVIMVDDIRSSIIYPMAKRGSSSHAGHCTAGTTLRKICLNPSLRDVVM